MKVGIFGDSFADTGPFTMISEQRMSWPLWIEKLSNHKVKSFGMSGSSLWFSYKNFLQNQHKFNIIIFCYTHYDRWFNINDYPGITHIVSEDNLSHCPEENRELLELLVKLRPQIYDEELNKFLYQSIFDSVNEICKEKNKQIINILTFEETFNAKISINLSKNSGTILTNLSSISHKEIDEAQKTKLGNELINLILKTTDFRFCHMNVHNNLNLAKIVIDSLENNKSYLNLINDSNWSFDVEHLIKYFN